MKVSERSGGFPVKFQISVRDTLEFIDLRATNIYVTLYSSRLFTHGILSSEGVSKLRFSIESSNENTVFFYI